MGFEKSAGLGVSNHYGPRALGGTEGVTNTLGTIKEFYVDLDGDSLAFGFPVKNGKAYVVECDISQATGTVTAQTIGGVDISGATLEAPVQIPAANTGVLVFTGATGGKVLIRYKHYAL